MIKKILVIILVCLGPCFALGACTNSSSPATTGASQGRSYLVSLDPFLAAPEATFARQLCVNILMVAMQPGDSLTIIDGYHQREIFSVTYPVGAVTFTQHHRQELTRREWAKFLKYIRDVASLKKAGGGSPPHLTRFLEEWLQTNPPGKNISEVVLVGSPLSSGTQLYDFHRALPTPHLLNDKWSPFYVPANRRDSLRGLQLHWIYFQPLPSLRSRDLAEAFWGTYFSQYGAGLVTFSRDFASAHKRLGKALPVKKFLFQARPARPSKPATHLSVVLEWKNSSCDMDIAAINENKVLFLGSKSHRKKVLASREMLSLPFKKGIYLELRHENGPPPQDLHLSVLRDGQLLTRRAVDHFRHHARYRRKFTNEIWRLYRKKIQLHELSPSYNQKLSTNTRTR